jgi:hypothetical protein
MVHEKVLEAYKAANVEYIETADDKAEEDFYRNTTWTGVGGARTQQPIKRTITTVVRTKIGAKEYMYYYEKLEAYDRLGNPKNHTKLHGKYERPDFRMEVDPRTNVSSGKEVTGHRAVYYIEYSRGLLESLLEQSDASYTSTQEEGVIIDAEVARREFFYVEIPGGDKYEIFSREEYLDGTYDELVAAGKAGKSLYEIRGGFLKAQGQPESNALATVESKPPQKIDEPTFEYRISTKSPDEPVDPHKGPITSRDRPDVS